MRQNYRVPELHLMLDKIINFGQRAKNIGLRANEPFIKNDLKKSNIYNLRYCLATGEFSAFKNIDRPYDGLLVKFLKYDLVPEYNMYRSSSALHINGSRNNPKINFCQEMVNSAFTATTPDIPNFGVSLPVLCNSEPQI